MMTGAEIHEFGLALETAYTSAVSFDALLLSIDQRPVARQTPINAALPDAMLQVVNNSVAEGWAPRLLAAVCTDRAENDRVKRFFAEHGHFDPGRNPHWGDPWQATRLIGEQLFMGRIQGRNQLKRMDGDPFGKKVMIITSESRQVGKTHTCSLIRFVREEPNHKITYIDLDERRFEDKTTAGHNLRAIAFELADSWGIDRDKLPKQDEEQEPRWAQLLAPFLIEHAHMNAGMVRWLVMDGFRKRDHPSAGVKELIDRLAEAIKSRRDFRFILLNYSEPLPLPVRFFEEVIKPLTEAEIAAALESAHLYYRRCLPTPAEMDDYQRYYTKRLAEYRRTVPEHADSHLLIHHAAADTVDKMQGAI